MTQTSTRGTGHSSRPVHVRLRTRRTGRWWPEAIAMACWASVLAVVALWLSGRGVQLLGSGPGDLLTSLGRLTGLVAADLLLIQVFLMARVPMIERSYGQDELARRHRLVGFWSFNLLLAHIVLITLGYTLTDHSGLLSEIWTIVTSYGGMLLAVAGTAALTAVTVTSVRAARRALRYESWHLLRSGPGLTSRPHRLPASTGGPPTRSLPARFSSSVSGCRCGARSGTASPWTR